jgi:hypothetical protein
VTGPGMSSLLTTPKAFSCSLLKDLEMPPRPPRPPLPPRPLIFILSLPTFSNLRSVSSLHSAPARAPPAM